jgi:hypothetical protein
MKDARQERLVRKKSLNRSDDFFPAKVERIASSPAVAMP